MKRFLLFAGENYYPGGGWNDFVGDFDEIYEAQDAIESTVANIFTKTALAGGQFYADWWQIVNRDTKAYLDKNGWHDMEVVNDTIVTVCSRCGQDIHSWQSYDLDKRGAHHRGC